MLDQCYRKVSMMCRLEQYHAKEEHVPLHRADTPEAIREPAAFQHQRLIPVMSSSPVAHEASPRPVPFQRGIRLRGGPR